MCTILKHFPGYIHHFFKLNQVLHLLSDIFPWLLCFLSYSLPFQTCFWADLNRINGDFNFFEVSTLAFRYFLKTVHLMDYKETSFIKQTAEKYSPTSTCLCKESVIETLHQLKLFVFDLSISRKTFSYENSRNHCNLCY